MTAKDLGKTVNGAEYGQGDDMVKNKTYVLVDARVDAGEDVYDNAG